MVASLWSMPVGCSDLLPPSLAVMVWSSAVMLPCETSGVPPWPSAFPSATIGSPTLTEDELAKLTVGRPDTLPSVWINAMSALGPTPITWAVYGWYRPVMVTWWLVGRSTTRLVVTLSPFDVTLSPVQ